MYAWAFLQFFFCFYKGTCLFISIYIFGFLLCVFASSSCFLLSHSFDIIFLSLLLCVGFVLSCHNYNTRWHIEQCKRNEKKMFGIPASHPRHHHKDTAFSLGAGYNSLSSVDAVIGHTICTEALIYNSHGIPHPFPCFSSRCFLCQKGKTWKIMAKPHTHSNSLANF